MREGQRVSVNKRDGSVKSMTVGKIVYSGKDVVLAAIGEERPSGGYRGGGRGGYGAYGAAQRGEYEQSDESILARGNVMCGDCRRLGRVCSSCRFDAE